MRKNDLRKIFKDDPQYAGFALSESEIRTLQQDCARRRGSVRTWHTWIALTHRLNTECAHKKRRARLPRNHHLARVLQKIEHDEQRLFFDVHGRIPKHGQKFAKERVGLWSIPRTSGRLLALLASWQRMKYILELGTSGGYSTLWLAHGIVRANTDGVVHTVENFPKKTRFARRQFTKSGYGNRIRLHQSDALTFIKKQKRQSIDMVFLDADKERYIQYLLEVERILKPGGVVVADNVFDFGKKMNAYLRRMRSSSRWRSHLVEMDNGLLVSQLIK
jgi:predicted O-methyltransferase YrrM